MTTRTRRGWAPGPGRRRIVGAATAVGALAVALAGCGSSSPSHPATTAVRGSAPSPKVGARLRAQEAAIHKRVTAALNHRSGGSYGTIPKDLRDHQKAPPNQVLKARPGHPSDAIEGIAVDMRLASGSALVTAVGPAVPAADQGSFHNHTNATWDVSFAHVHGTVPIARRMFTIIDEQGTVLRPQITVRGGGALPDRAPASGTLTLILHARTSIGDGKVRYAPVGGQLLAEWDFDAETD